MTIDLYIIRHAEAEERDPAIWPDDRLRTLTSKGRKQFKRLARALRSLEPRPRQLLSSRFVRAWDTAEIVQDAADWPKPDVLESLEDRPAAEIVQSLQAIEGSPCLAIVGHEPALSETISLLLAGDPDRISIDLEKGGVVLLRFSQRIEAGAAMLRWYATPTLARASRR